MARRLAYKKNSTGTRGYPAPLAILGGEQGMALLITLMLLSAMVALTLYLHKKTSADQTAARVFAEEQRLRVIALGAARLGQAALVLPGSADGSTTLLDPWATLTSEDVAKLFPDVVPEVAIVDLSGRFQINSLVEAVAGKGPYQGRPTEREQRAREALLRLLTSGDFAVAGDWEAQQVVDALVDWLDPDDRLSPWGAESGYYQGMEPPYGCRNGRVRFLEELLLVRGITPELLFGTASTKALADHVTVYGSDGRINLNTAPLPLLRALNPAIEGELLIRLDAYRRDPRHRGLLGDPGWYKNIGGWPGDIVLYEDLLTIRSTFFQVKATARQGVVEKTASTVAERVGRSQLRIRWQKIE